MLQYGAGGYFLYKKNKKQDPMELDWVKTYYNYMRNYNETVQHQQKVMRYYREDEKIEFCQVDKIDKPVLLYRYKELGQSFITIFYISSENTVNEISGYSKYLTVECIFDIDERKFDYYIHETNSNEDIYTKISDAIIIDEYNKKIDLIDIQDKEYKEVEKLVFKKDEKETVTTYDEKEISILKFDKKFIKTNMVEMNWNSINLNSYEDSIKRDFSTAVNNMVHELTEDEKNIIASKEREINNLKQEMENAVKEKEEYERLQKEAEEKAKEEEEARQRALEEEENKRQEEELKRQLQERELINQQRQANNTNNTQNFSGSYTLRTGTYKGIDYQTPGDTFSKYEITITLNENGTYTQSNYIIAASMYENYSGTFIITMDSNLGEVIRFNTADSTYTYLITGNDQFTSTSGSGGTIKYIGN